MPRPTLSPPHSQQSTFITTPSEPSSLVYSDSVGAALTPRLASAGTDPGHFLGGAFTGEREWSDCDWTGRFLEEGALNVGRERSDLDLSLFHQIWKNSFYTSIVIWNHSTPQNHYIMFCGAYSINKYNKSQKKVNINLYSKSPKVHTN